jgi:RHS repeat-associated protein
VSFDGVNDVVADNGISNLTNNFTVSFWAQPNTTDQIDSESTSGTGGVSGQRYAIWPLWHTNGHAGAGISVGTNGVSVYEHTDNYMPATLVYSGSLSGWTHVTVVYENKQPKLYINGTLVRIGLTSPMSYVNINPLEIGGDVYGYYSGKLDDVRVYDHALSASEVNTLANGSSSTQIKWLVTDHLGTPRLVLDQTGSLATVTRHDYLPFGEEISILGLRTPSLGYSIGDGVRQQFTLKERDVETGLDYFLARYYASSQGRFTSPDEFKGGPEELFADVDPHDPLFYAEIAEPQSLNKYHYALNNPLRYIDPDGHQTTTADTINRAADFLTGVGRGITSSITLGASGAPKETDSLLNRAGQGVGTVITNLAARASVGLGGGSTVLTAGASAEFSIPAVVVGVEMGVGSTLNAIRIATTPMQQSASRDSAGSGSGQEKTNSQQSAGQTSAGRPTDQHGRPLGPSGKPIIHQKNFPTMKAAKDAARNAGNGSPMKHPNPTRGEPHFHPTKDGMKVRDGTHYNYPIK